MTNLDGSEYVGQVWPGYTVCPSYDAAFPLDKFWHDLGIPGLVSEEYTRVVDRIFKKLERRGGGFFRNMVGYE